MSAYKKLNKQDAYITTYIAHKQWEVKGNDFASYGIDVVPSVSGIYLNSLQHLYYPTKISGSIPSHSFDYYHQSTLYNSQSRQLNTGSFLISLPRNVVGTHINPGVGLSFQVDEAQQVLYVSGTYWGANYSNDPFQGSLINTVEVDDDGEGNLYISGSSPREYIGDIIYPHGMIIITNPIYSEFLSNAWNGLSSLSGESTFLGQLGNTRLRRNITLNWESSQPIFTYNYHCKLRDFEYNYTYNPTAVSSSTGTVYDNNDQVYSTTGSIHKGDLNNNITGSSFTPYITTVGLYNDAQELIAVGKLNRPVPKTKDTEMTIIVKIDI